MRRLLKSIARKTAYVFATVIIMAAIVVCIVRFLTPILDEHRADFEKLATQLLQTPVTIKNVQVSWFQYQPVISLNEVTILNKDTKEPILQIKKVNILFSIPETLWQRKVVPSGIMIAGASLTINQSSTGELMVRGFSSFGFNQQPYKSETRFVDFMAWLSQQPYLILRDIDLRYAGYKSEERLVTLYDLSFENSNNEHTIQGKAILHQELPTEVSLVTQWTGETVDLTKLQAQIYLYVSGLSIAQWSKGFAWQGWQVKDGVASAKIWATWSEGKFQKIQTAFQSYGLSLYSQADKSTHRINRLSGNIGWKREGDTQVFAGDDLLLDLPNHLWPVTSFYISLSPDANGNLLPKAADLGYIDLADVQSYLFSAPALVSDPVKKMLAALNVRGNLQNTAVVFSGAWNDYRHIALNASFNQLSFAAWQNYPGITNLSGAVKWNGSEGKVQLDTAQTVFRYDSLFTDVLALDQLKGDVQVIQDQNQDWILTSPGMNVVNKDLTATIRGKFTIPVNASPVADINADFSLQNAARIARYLPMRIFDKDLNEWLKQAFLKGKVTSGNAVLRGPVNDFPFDSGNGTFSITGTVNDIDFQFAPDWPMLRQVNGKLEFSGRKIVIDVDHASTLGIPIGNVHGVIPYLGDAQPQILQVQTGDIQTDFAQALQYVHTSPLEKSIGKMFAGVDMNGPITLRLGLTVPLKNPDDTQIQGDLSVNNGEMDLTPWNLNLQRLNGQVKFTEKTTQAKGIQAVLFNKPLQFDLSTVQKTKNVSVVRASFTNILNISDLESWLRIPFSKLVRGSADVTGTIDFSLTSPIDIHLQSNLVGVSVNLIDEFNKKAQEAKDFTADILVQDGQPMRLKLGYDGLLNTAMILDRKQGKFSLVSADFRLGTGEASWPNVPGIYISGVFDKLDLEKIKKYLNQPGGSSMSLSILKGIDIQANDLKVGGKEFTKVHIQAAPVQGGWNANVSSNEISGQIKIPVPFNKQSLITAQIQKIDMRSTAGAGGRSTALFDIKTLPAISLVANDVKYNNMSLGQMAFKAVPGANGLVIQSLKLVSPRIDLKATGQWIQSGNGYLTQLQGVATSTRVSDLLNSLGMDANNFVAGNGSLTFNLNWNDAPYAPSIASINGHASLILGPGRIVDIGKEGGAKMDLGRMLSIFSLQTIPRRLSLDFSDVFQKGYSFDSVRGDFNIQSGDVYTRNLRFDGPVASVSINGRIGLKDKDYNFILSVTAHVTSSLPVAATLLTGNPLIGLGAFAVNTVIGSQVSNATTYYYSVTGPWNNPSWKAVSASKGVKP